MSPAVDPWASNTLCRFSAERFATIETWLNSPDANRAPSAVRLALSWSLIKEQEFLDLMRLDVATQCAPWFKPEVAA